MNKKIEYRPILFISDNFPPVIGGSSTVYDQICKNNANSIVALSSRISSQGIKKKGTTHYDQSCGYLMYRIEHLRVPYKANYLQSKIHSVFRELFLMLKIMLKITQICLKHQVKVICVGELVYGGWVVLFARFILNKKTLLYTHGEEISQTSSGFYNKYRGIFLNGAHKIISVSLFCKSQIVSLYHIPPNNIEIISNGVDTHRFKPGKKNTQLLQQHNIKVTDKVILSVGRLVKRKGHYNLIQAMSTIIEQSPNAKLIIIGSGPEEGTLINLAKTLKLNQHIIFLNKIDDDTLIHYYQSSDVFAMPNITLDDGDTEGFGLVFLEANACKKPGIGGQAGGAIEAIIHEQTGLLVDGYNVQDIVQSILRLLQDQTLYTKTTQRGYTFAQQSTWIEKAKQFANLTNNLTKLKQTSITQCFPNSEKVLKNTNANTQKFLHITVDFEEMFDWSDITKGNASVNGIKELEKFHLHCTTNNIQPTYLVTHKVLTSNNAVDFLKTIYTGHYEIGIHLHPWNSPPYIENINIFNSYQCNLPNYLEELKIVYLIELFEEKLGFKPLIHRAGRYGVSSQTHQILKSHGFKIDLSPSAGFNFNPQGGPNFDKLSNIPFWTDLEKKLLCFPVPGVEFLKGPDYLTKLFYGKRSTDNALRRGLKKSLPVTPVRLSPETHNLERLKLIATILEKQSINDYILSVHSTSLYKSGNEYSVTESDVQKNIDNIINFALWSKETLNTQNSTLMDSFSHYN